MRLFHQYPQWFVLHHRRCYTGRMWVNDRSQRFMRITCPANTREAIDIHRAR
jgi:hypothetical protein